MNQTHENIIEQSREIWRELTLTHPEKNKLYDEPALEALSRSSNSVIAIISIKDYRKLYVSKNVMDIYGYTAEDEPNLGVLKYIKMVTFDHILFPIIAGRFYIKCLKSISYEEKINQRIVFVGVKFKTRFNKIIRTFVQTSHLIEDQERNPIDVMNSVQDISHLMKEDFWWMRFSSGENNEKVKYYHSSMGKIVEGDVISDREKDILKLIQLGLDSPEIADKLCLSLSTVHTHRKNMLARTGMKDVTGLLQVALSVGII
jgi:DNA-binding CsgD family transcriptional regulator